MSEKHPKTADGVPIMLGDTVWVYDPEFEDEDEQPQPLGVVMLSTDSIYRDYPGGDFTIGCGDDGWEFGHLEVWSTEAAAKQSKVTGLEGPR